jgi:hypothetical protein
MGDNKNKYQIPVTNTKIGWLAHSYQNNVTRPVGIYCGIL